MAQAVDSMEALRSAFMPLADTRLVGNALLDAGILRTTSPLPALQIGHLHFKTYRRASSWTRTCARVVYRVRNPNSANGGADDILHGWARLRAVSPAQLEHGASCAQVGALDLRLRQWPDDAALPALRTLYCDSKAITALSPTVVSYRPGVRAVLRFIDPEQGTVRYAKVFADRELAQKVYARSQRIHAACADSAPFRSALPLAFDQPNAAVWHQGVSGVNLSERVTLDLDAGLADPLAQSLIALHGLRHTDLIHIEAVDLLDDALKKLARLRSIRPAFTSDFARLQRMLQRSMHDAIGQPAVSLHGDFHLRQMLMSDEGITLCDFDELSLGAPEIDVASLMMDLATHRMSTDAQHAWLEAFPRRYAARAPWGLHTRSLRWHLIIQAVNKMYRACVQLLPGLSAHCRHYLTHLDNAIGSLQP